jgi:peptidoglycan hydrolase CwlO-like protein
VKGEGGARLSALSMGKAPGPGIRDLRTSTNKQVPKIEPAVRPILEPYNGRERELEDREKEVKEMEAALEAESKEMEAAAREMEKERQALKEARDRIAKREEELDAKAILLEDVLTVTQDIKKEAPAALSPDDKEVLRPQGPSSARCWARSGSASAGRSSGRWPSSSPGSISWRPS